MVEDADNKPDPGKGAEDDPAVLNVHPFLVIQAEGPQITVNEEVQSGHGIANRKCVEPSNLSKMYSEDALETMNRTKTL